VVESRGASRVLVLQALSGTRATEKSWLMFRTAGSLFWKSSNNLSSSWMFWPAWAVLFLRKA
jgi:hypothetical protein